MLVSGPSASLTGNQAQLWRRKQTGAHDVMGILPKILRTDAREKWLKAMVMLEFAILDRYLITE